MELCLNFTTAWTICKWINIEGQYILIPDIAMGRVDEPDLASIMTHDHAKDLCASEHGPMRIYKSYGSFIDWFIDWLIGPF